MSTEHDNSTGTKVQEDEYKQVLADLLKTVSANPAELKFPKDIWGFTSGVRREVLKAASSIQGHDRKHELLVMTLAILIQHVHARLPKDKAASEQRMKRRREAATGRAVKETFSNLSASKDEAR